MRGGEPNRNDRIGGRDHPLLVQQLADEVIE
jgi:hypothetical protein